MTLILLQIIIEATRSTLIWVGFAIGIRRRPGAGSANWAWIIGSAIVSAVWLAAIVAFASSQPLTLLVVPVAVALTVSFGLLLLASPGYRAIIAAIPQHWLIGIQAFRVIGGIFLIRYFQGDLPGIFAIPAGIGDVLTGLLAPFVAIGLARGKPYGRAAAIAWNIFGMADLINALTLGALFLGSGLDFPAILVPIYGVPRALVMHGYSLLGLLGQRRPIETAPTRVAHS